jgi:hypothetical protein
MKELTRFDYMYIIIIILLVASLIWVFLPFIYSTFNGNIDSSDCITDTDSIKCDGVGSAGSNCEYNCTFKNGNSISRRTMIGG